MQQVRLFGMEVHPVRQDEAVEQILQWVSEPAGQLRYVVTPNVQHTVLFESNADFREAYRAASLVLIDGAPLIWASRLLGRDVRDRVAGSDLVPALFARADPARPLKVYLLGAAPGIADRAGREVERCFAGVRIVGTYSPPLGFEHDEAENARISQLVELAAPDLLVLGLGSPKQELWMYRHRAMLSARVALCAGATIDFLAHVKSRAPRWMRRAGLEWVHRVATEPRRLAPRYAGDALRFPWILLNEWRNGRKPRPDGQ